MKEKLPATRYWTAVAAITGLAGLLLCLFPSWTVDDAYISYRYAQTWVETGQLAWNPGAPPVEGFTGYALVLLAAACLHLGIPPEVGLDWICGLATLAALPLQALLWPRIGIGRPLSLALLLLYALNPALYLHGGSGLETSLFTLGVVAWLLWISAAEPTQWLRQGWLGMALGLGLVLVRPEGVVLAAVAAALYLQAAWKARRWAAMAWPLLGLAILALGYVWRYQHFGTWLPNTFWAKRYTGLLNPESIKEALRFAAYYVLLPLGAGGLLCYMDPEAVRARLAGPRAALLAGRIGRVLLAGLLAAGILLLAYFRAHLYMGYGGRFFFPLLPVAWVLAGLALQAGLDNYRAFLDGFPLRARLARWTLMGLALLQVLALGYKWRAETAWLRRYAAIVDEELVPIGQALRQRFPGGGRLICYMDAGAIPYFSRLETTDFGRLNDALLPTYTQGDRACIDHFFAQAADAVVMTSTDAQIPTYTDESRAILDDPRFSAYQLHQVYRAQGVTDYFQYLYLRKITP